MPDLFRYQFREGPRAGEPITERGEIERLARACQVGDFRAGLDSTVIETRFNVVRSSVPDMVDTVRRLRDYLPHVDQGGTPVRGEVSPDEAAMTVGVWSRPAAPPPPRSRLDDQDSTWPDHLNLRARWHTALGGPPDGTRRVG